MKQLLRFKTFLIMAVLAMIGTSAWADDVTDVLTQPWTGVTGTNYTAWSDKTATSDAVYAGQSAGGNSSIQLRSDNNNSGVVTTTSGGKVKSITVTWNSNTSNGRTLNVYGKNTAYSAATDLYNTSNQGTLLGTIACGTSTSLTIDGDYEYIGFRSASSAMYLEKVEIVWEVAGGTTLEESNLALTGAPVALTFDLYNNSGAQVVNYTTLSTGAVSIADNDYASFAIDETAKTITVTPTAVTPSAQTIIVNQTADEAYKAGTAQFTVRIDDSTPFSGGDVTFDATTDTGSSPLTKNKVSFTCSNGVLNNGSEYRLYKNSTTTFSLSEDIISEGYVITSIVFTGVSGNPASGFGSQEGWTTDGNNGIWTGSATSVSFTASGAQVRATKIVVTVEAPTPKVLSSIALSGEYPTTFHVGDAFSHGDMVVTATYDDASTKDVTTDVTFSGYDMATAGNQTVTVSYAEGEVTKTATYEITVNAPAVLTGITLSGTYQTEFQQGDAFSHNGLTVTANYDDNTTSDVTSEATFSGYDMSTLGEQVVTVSYEGQTATYNITVVEKKGTEAKPYTVAEARAAIDAGTGVTGVYATGIVSEIVTAYSSQYGNITYNISTDGSTTSDQLQAYRGKSYDGANFTSEDDIKVGDVVVIYGNLKKYSSTYEFDTNNQLVSLQRPAVTTPSITITPDEYEMDAKAGGGEIPVTCENLATDPQLAVVFCEADGETPATYDWISATINTDGNIDGEILANTGEARTAYFYVTGKDANGNTVNSNLVTFTQNGASIEVTGSLDFTAEGQSKTVNIDFGGLENPTFEVNFFEADGTTSATYDWVSTAITSENKIDLTIEANTGAARTAYFKVQDTTSGLSSELVTINQEAYVAPATGDSYELYTGALTEGDYIIYYDGKAMNTTVSSDRLQYAEIEPNSDVITTSDASIVWHIAPSGEYWTIYNADANAYAASTGAKNKAQMLEDGTDDKALWTVSGTETYEFVNKQNTSNSVNANLRNNAAYGFACYGTSTGGALSLYKKVVNSTEPSIKVNPKNVDATSAETEGTITVTYVNFEPADKEIQTVAADGETSATYGWLITDFDATTGNIEYLIGENTATEARTAYLKVYALDDEANDVYSELITINQAAYVAPAPAGVWVKTDLADLTSRDVFVIVGNDGYNNAMTNDNGTSSAPAAVEVTVTGDMITSNVADNMKWNISGDATDGYTFYPNGDSEKWLYCTNTNNGVRVGTNENKNFTVSNEGYLVNSATSRYIGVYTGTSGSDWRCYTTINNNIKDQTFSFYKFTDHLSVTVSTVGYATLYYGETNLVVPEGVEAYTYKVTDGKLDESYLYEANEVIPAGTGVVLKANAGEYKFVVTTEVGLEDSDNLLCGSDVAVTTEGPAAGDYLFYLLGVVDSKVGFYWGKEDGAAFTSGAHKAYLAVPAEQAAGVRGFTFDGTTVGISTIGVQMPEGEAYDLQGRRVQQLQKGGLYIVGGKKMLAK